MFGSTLSTQSPFARASRRNPAQKGVLARWIMARRTRAALRALDAHLLEDIGMTEGEAMRESARPFWQ